MAVAIDGPVGLRWRSVNVTNNTRDQDKIIKLLASIAETQGGKKLAWARPPSAGPDRNCPKELAEAIFAFQSHWKNKGVFKNIDGVVDPGLNTLRKMNELAASAPPPVPPPPTPVLGTAGVQIGPVGPRRSIIAKFYQLCGLETIGPGQVRTSDTRDFKTLEDLIDLLLVRPEFQQVIVNHGDPARGLILPCAKETSFSNTGQIIGDLSGLADIAEKGGIDPTNAIAKVLLDGAAADMRVGQSVVLRLVNKLVLVRKKQQVLHFRACSLDDPVLVAKYKKAFGARMITFHPVRLLFLLVKPAQLKSNQLMSQFQEEHSTPRDRMRVFHDPLGLIHSIVIAVRDLDGHTNVIPFSFLERIVPDEIREWADFFVTEWRDSSPSEFVVPVMWDNRETTFHFPRETGWRLKLRFV